MATKEEKRRAAAERKQRSRQRKLAKENPEAAQELQRQAEEQQAAKAQEEQAKATAQATKEEQDKLEEQAFQRDLHGCLSGTMQVLCGAYNRSKQSPEGTPGLGQERADEIARLWTPVLAPLLREYRKDMVPFFAITTTVGLLAEWKGERDDYVKQHKPRVVDAEGPLG